MTRPKALQITSQLPWWLSSSLINGALWPSGIVFEGVAMLPRMCNRFKGDSSDNEQGFVEGDAYKDACQQASAVPVFSDAQQAVRVPRSR